MYRGKFNMSVISQRWQQRLRLFGLFLEPSFLPSFWPRCFLWISSVFVGWGHCLVTIIITLSPRLLFMNRGHQDNYCLPQNTGFTLWTGPNPEKILRPFVRVFYNRKHCLCISCLFSALLSWRPDISVGILAFDFYCIQLLQRQQSRLIRQ